MYRLCNPADPSLFTESERLDQLFDFRNTLELQHRLQLTPTHFFKWVRATVTDDTFESHLRAKVRSAHGYNIENDPHAHMHQLYRLILQDQPKWLIEFITLVYSNSSVTLSAAIPTITPESEGLRYQPLQHVFTYTNQPASYYDNPIEGVVPSFNDSQAAEMRTFVDQVLSHFTRFTNESANAHSDMDDQYLIRCDSHSRLLHIMYRYLVDRPTISYRRAGRDSETIRPSSALNRYTCLARELQARANIEIVQDGANFVILYREPRFPATREQLGQILNYTTNVLDMLPFNMRGDGEQFAPLYGVELEACSNYHPTDIIAAQQELFFILKQDGSISGEGRHKYEMVTVPCTLKAHKRMWADFFNKVDYTQFDTSKNTGNGMHVHIDRKAFKSKAHLNRFTWFFINPANFDFLFEVSERPTKNDLNRWAPLPALHDHDRKAQVMRQATSYNRNLRGTVHFKGDKTVEIRMFKGVVSYATVVKNLEFVDSVFHFTMSSSTLNVTLPNYFAWLNAQSSNRYQLIREFIKQAKNLEQILLSNELKEYLFNTSKPESVLAKLQKAKFKITNKHLTVLNREKRKRTFVLDKEGNVQLAYSNTGKLAALDKSMQAKLTRGTANIHIALV